MPHESDSARDLTAAERRWLNRLQRTLDAQPSTLVIYCHGDSATALDRGVAATDDLRGAVIYDALGIRTSGWIAGDF